MTTSRKCAFYLPCLLLQIRALMTEDWTLSTSQHHDRKLVSAQVGHNVTLSCFLDGGDSAWLFWFKQTQGEKPRLISTSYVYRSETIFHNEFKDNQRFAVLGGKYGAHHLVIFNLRISDSATYLCANTESYDLTFTKAVTVSVGGSGVNVQTLVHQASSENIQPGGSVTLSCTVHTGTCDGEHSVYWFKNSDEHQPGLLYTHGDKRDQCERKPDTQTHTCVYNLSLRSLNHSDAGTYYCAVASCGHILFGNGTRLKLISEVNDLPVCFLSGALAVTTILTVSLAIAVYKTYKRKRRQCKELQATHPEQSQDEDNLHYAALKVQMPKRSRRLRDNAANQSVYSSLSQ